MDFQNRDTRHEAHYVGFGPEITIRMLAPDHGPFLSLGLEYGVASLTRRDAGRLQEDAYTRSRAIASVGWHFRGRFGVGIQFQDINVDQDLQLRSTGVFVRMGF